MRPPAGAHPAIQHGEGEQWTATHRGRIPADGPRWHGSGYRRSVIVTNETPYPTAEVARIVTRGFAGAGPRPRRVIVQYRTLRTDTRQGFTPYDHSKPVMLWVEPANRYPQPGARSWRDELFTSAAHEAHHYRHPGCRGGQCEVAAESYAQRERKRSGR